MNLLAQECKKIKWRKLRPENKNKIFCVEKWNNLIKKGTKVSRIK